MLVVDGRRNGAHVLGLAQDVVGAVGQLGGVEVLLLLLFDVHVLLNVQEVPVLFILFLLIVETFVLHLQGLDRGELARNDKIYVIVAAFHLVVFGATILFVF